MRHALSTEAVLLALLTLAACSDDPDYDSGGGVGTGDPTAALKVYGHSDRVLYEIDPETLAVTEVGTFACDVATSDITDLSIDRDGRMIAVSFNSIYWVDARTAECRWLASLGGTFNGLSFIPAGQIDGVDEEILVGVTTTGQVSRVDPITGETTPIGSYDGFSSSGDLVSVIGLGTLATVVGGASDLLAWIDPTTGTATAIGETGAVSLWGLAFWGSTLYGFSEQGALYRLDVETGAATEIETDTNVRWWGAAVTTSAPVEL